MHPVIIEAVAAERSKDLQAQAASGRRARQIRRTRPAGQPRLRRPILRIPLRAPRAA
jgi:hypothetical protein